MFFDFMFHSCFFVSVLNHFYGREGRESKKIDAKSFPLDFEFFQHLTHPEFVTALQTNINQFTETLNQQQHHKGMTFLQLLGGLYVLMFMLTQNCLQTRACLM